MKIEIHLDEDEIEICRNIISQQSHFALNSECIEDAVITGILSQIHNNTHIWHIAKLITQNGEEEE